MVNVIGLVTGLSKASDVISQITSMSKFLVLVIDGYLSMATVNVKSNGFGLKLVESPTVSLFRMRVFVPTSK